MKNILCVRSDRFGEFLLSLPAIKLLKINYPESKIYLLAQKNNLELVSGIDFIDYSLEYNAAWFSGYRGIINLILLFKKYHIDTIVILNPKKEFHIAAFLAGIKIRLGYDRKWGFCLNHKIADNKHLEEKNEVKYNIDLIKAICQNTKIPEINLPIENTETLKFLSSFIDLSQKYIVIHPFTSHPPKKIADDFWDQLYQKILLTTKNNIIIIGGLEDRSQYLKIPNPARIKNLVGHLSLPNLACFLKNNCSVFVGLDSGPMHLAATLKLPLVGLFKTTNPKRWGPFETESLVLQGKDTNDFINRIEDILYFVKSKM